MKLGAILAASACIVALPATAEESVNYASYGGAYQEGVRKAILDHLPADHGMTVVDYTLGGGISDIRTRVAANANELDVVELYGGYCDTAANEGLLVPLDYSQIPNASGIPEELRKEHWVGFTAIRRCWPITPISMATTRPRTGPISLMSRNSPAPAR